VGASRSLRFGPCLLVPRPLSVRVGKGIVRVIRKAKRPSRAKEQGPIHRSELGGHQALVFVPEDVVDAQYGLWLVPHRGRYLGQRSRMTAGYLRGRKGRSGRGEAMHKESPAG